MYMGKALIQGFECDRCGHQWIPRLKIDEEPTICPKCKSPYWNKPRRIDLAKQESSEELVKEELKKALKSEKGKGDKKK